SPRTSTPPIPGCTAHRISASCSRSCPTTAENGKPDSSPAPLPPGERGADDSAVSTCDTDTHRLYADRPGGPTTTFGPPARSDAGRLARGRFGYPPPRPDNGAGARAAG